MRVFSQTERNALAKAISLYQASSNFSFDVFLKETDAWVIGITGAGGVGKSTLLKPLLKTLRRKDFKTAILAIDPSSEKDGGALLGDRIRVRDNDLDTDTGIFFRSLATHGAKSALTNSLSKMIKHAKQFSDVVIVETAGAGQADVDIRKYVDTLVQVLAPLGDAVTLAKAGQGEYAHIFAVNDRESFVRQETKMFFAIASIELGKEQMPGFWQKKVFLLNALENSGIEEFVEGLFEHQEFIEKKQTAKLAL